jgi:hypothetical protein
MFGCRRVLMVTLVLVIGGCMPADSRDDEQVWEGKNPGECAEGRARNRVFWLGGSRYS